VTVLFLKRAAPAMALLLSACWVPMQKGREMEARLGQLEVESNRRYEEQQRILKERVATADRKIAEVQQKIDELNHAARRSGADLGVSLSRLQDDVNRLRGDLEVNQHRLAQLEQAQQATDARQEKRFAALKGRGALDELEAKERIDSLQKPDDKVAFMALAQKEETQGDKGVARQLYDEYVRRWPTDANAAEAAFRSAQLSEAQRRWREAMVSYGWIYEKAPASPRAPDALLGLGRAMMELDELKKDAPGVLREVTVKYPKTPAAAQAKELLQGLTAKKPAPRRKQ
jgi:TolA-binding protein